MAAEPPLQRVASAVQIDPVEAFFLGRPLPPTTSQNHSHERSLNGLRALARDYAWGSVLELATSILADDDDAMEVSNAVAAISLAESAAADAGPRPSLILPHERLLCEAYRALALVQTRMVDRAALCLEALGSLSPGNPKYRYESFPDAYPGHAPGSFVPFELLSVSVEIRVRRGDASSIAECYKVKAQFPEHRLYLTSALIGYHLRAQQLDTAVDLARDLVSQQKSSARSLYLYGRILLHIGDVIEARRVFRIADAREDASDELRHVHCALALSTQGEHVRALAENDIVIRAQAESTGGSRHVRAFAHCNAAICLMQLGRLADAIKRLEICLREDPVTALDEGLIFNLCTMYDLAYPDGAAEKKSVLNSVAARYGRQGFNLEL
jgi:trafficking protein particle complex subunit 12